MSKKYLIVTANDLDEMQKNLNNGAAVGYRLVVMMPVYVPYFFSQKLHGYVAVVEVTLPDHKRGIAP